MSEDSTCPVCNGVVTQLALGGRCDCTRKVFTDEIRTLRSVLAQIERDAVHFDYRSGKSQFPQKVAHEGFQKIIRVAEEACKG